MKNKNAFTLTEVLVSILISAILILTIGVISSISNSTHTKLEREAQVYNDITYGFKLIQNRVHSVSSIKPPINQTGNWIGQHIEVGNGAFGLYEAPGGKSRDFVYVPDKSDENAREAIFSVPKPADLALTVTSDTKSFTINIAGTKDNMRFNLSTTAMKRI